MDQETNQTETEQITTEKITKHEDIKSEEARTFIKTLLIGLLIFLGAYCAFYTVADWHMKHVISPLGIPFGMHDRMLKMDNTMNKELKNFDKMIKSETQNIAQVIHMEESDKKYKIKIDLRAFDNNPNNIQVKRSGNLLTIKGRTISKHQNNQQISEFQQSYMFENNVNLKEMTKEIDDNYMVIQIPINH